MNRGIRHFFITSLWGQCGALNHYLSTFPSDTILHLLGNYFDNGPEPELVLDRLNQLYETQGTKVIFYRHLHDEAFLRLTGYLEDSDSYRRFWISPYLGTPYTLSRFNINPWAAYTSVGITAPKVFNPVSEFLISRTQPWAKLPISTGLLLELESSMTTDDETLALSIVENGQRLTRSESFATNSRFFEETVCPWVTDQLNRFLPELDGVNRALKK